MIEEINKGEFVSEETAFHNYFSTMQRVDPDYFFQLERMVNNRQKLGFTNNSQLQIVVPAYREGPSMSCFLRQIKDQCNNYGQLPCDFTFVFDHAVPYRNRYENTARKEMELAIKLFLESFPEISPHINFVSYKRRKSTNEPVLPVGLARKVGEDVLMLERLRKKEESSVELPPLYLGLMDIDTSNLSFGLFEEMHNLLPSLSTENPRIVRVQGSYDRNWLRMYPQLHALEMMWEGVFSAIGNKTRHNPFNIGRLSAVPARELAITGGGFPGKLNFTDEDIRHGIQIAWQLKNIQTVEPKGKYATSPRREIHTVNGVKQLLSESSDLTVDLLQCAALIKMYAHWSQNMYRDQATPHEDALLTYDAFMQHTSAPLIEGFTNAFFRFTAFSIIAIDELSDLAPEITELKNKFLSGEIAYFEVELGTIDFLRQLSKNPERTASLLSKLQNIVKKSTDIISQILQKNGIDFDLLDLSEIPLGINEGNVNAFLHLDPNQILQPVYKIHGDLTAYYDNFVKML
ncbi:hypothetical protein KC726_04260 [Candidatus Woesebacteria bacterium]|nr:hypothetical protein [Candidatus Woesebacteria bacterium]